MARSRRSTPQPTPSPQDELLDRARRLARKGERRRAWLTLQEASAVHFDDARVWALYAAQSRRMNRLDEAEKAFSQALYLREQQRDTARADVLRRLLADLRSERQAA
jgi:Flp pilus assembly protein TadD